MPGGLFAGSGLSTEEVPRNARDLAGVPLKKTMRMAVRTLAAVFGLDDKPKKHSSRPDDALNPEDAVQEPIVAGETICGAEEDTQ